MKEKIIESCLCKIRNISGNENSARVFLISVFELFSKIKDTKPVCDLVALDWAGIGDAVCHSRLILQHFLPKKILWITTPTVYGLFKDDYLMDVRSGFNGPRGVGSPYIIDLATQVDEIMKEVFQKETLSISRNIIRDFSVCMGKKHNFSDGFFCSSGIEKNKDIKHILNHNGRPTIKINRKYVAVEHCSNSGAPSNLESYKKLFSRIKDKYDIALLGASNDIPIGDAIDCRGMSLYDTFSIIKNCHTFIGKSSGNQSLMCFLHHIPLIEVNVTASASYQECGLHPNVRKVILPEEAEKYL